MQYTEQDLITKDKVLLKSYIILQQDTEMAKKTPTILYFHVSENQKIYIYHFFINFKTYRLMLVIW